MPGSVFPERLLQRELGARTSTSRPKGIYGDRTWVHDLDIVSELDGHSGCVNALSWSKSGRLLASGSDDVHVNIHTYHPEHSDRPLQLSTSISTGHSANIFSVKFMPHSSDRTLLSAAGDGEIRIFDIEYAGRSAIPSGPSSAASSARANTLGGNIRFLSEADTSAKVFRSHSDRVKRLVTESSPFLFLSCSEDGDVRQWDTRQPSSAYPRPAGTRSFNITGDAGGEAPPPLISYRRQQMDLNTISCSPSQPHYIALGGAHLHCFLHDRRMLGRDRLRERGERVRFSPSSEQDDDLLSEATQCVRRFAPKGQSRMKVNDSGHITACKISDANPNEMVVSWSGDWIYNFDLIRSPDARHQYGGSTSQRLRQKTAVRESRDRKRKRTPAHSAVSQEGTSRGGSKARTNTSSPQQEASNGGSSSNSMALRVRYQNGQSEDIPMPEGPSEESLSPGSLPDAGPSYAIARAVAGIRKHMFALPESEKVSKDDPLGFAKVFSQALSLSAATLQKMESIMRSWRYLMDVSQTEIESQKILRRNRDRSRRFVQASAVVSRILGGKVIGSGWDADQLLDATAEVRSSDLEKTITNPHEQFCHDFLKAICLWLGSGVNALVEGFSSASPNRPNSRHPLSLDASAEDVDDHLIPYLLKLATNKPIQNVDVSRFEHEENRTLINSEKAAVIAFSRAIKMPFEDLSARSAPASSDEQTPPPQERKAALRYWGLRVARGLLMSVGEGINFELVDHSFGGLGKPTREVRALERDLERQQEDISDTEETPVSAVGLEGHSDEEMVDIDHVHDVLMGVRGPDQTDEDLSDRSWGDESPFLAGENDGIDAASSGSDGDGSVDDEDEGEEEDEDEDEDDPDLHTSSLFRAAMSRGSSRRNVHLEAPCVPPQMHYRGAANVRTVKDVNFYGLQDEYVVSGSDSGHFFIWDRRTGQLLNILEGDGEVVNVVTGHPSEPMLAVSGIDHSVKIFSPDARLRANARAGIGVSALDYSAWSSISLGGRGNHHNRRRAGADESAAGDAGDNSAARADPDSFDSDADDGAPLSPHGLASRRRMHEEYRITSQNDVDRRGGQREAFITRSMLAQLAARMRMRRRRGGGAQGGEDEGDEDEGEDDVEDEGDDAEVPVIDLGGGRVIVGQECNVQ